MRYLSLTLVLVLMASTLALGQIIPTSPARQRAANRQALRDDRHTEAAYKESHLDVTRRQLKRGSSEPAKAVAGEPRFGRDGTPHVSEPKFPGLRRRKPKNEPTP